MADGQPTSVRSSAVRWVRCEAGVGRRPFYGKLVRPVNPEPASFSSSDDLTGIGLVPGVDALFWDLERNAVHFKDPTWYREFTERILRRTRSL